jgi:alanine racemase
MKQTLPLSYIEISKKNLIHNIKQFRGLVRKGTKIAGVIKANAYGHGDKEVAKILASYVDYFQVNSVEELVRVRSVTKKQVLLLGYVAHTDLREAMKLGCILTVFDFEHMLLVNQSARSLGIQQKVHIAIDAHLGREGFMMSNLEFVMPEFAKMKNLVIDGVYAHFANIEDIHPDGLFGTGEDFSHARLQIEVYQNVLNIFRTYGYNKIHTHISATSGVLVYEQGLGLHSIVRVGVGLYGMWPSDDLKNKYRNKMVLKPVMRWVTHVAQVKTLPKGHSIGYGLTYVTERETKIAVIPQGYSNGLPRSHSNKGEVLIRGVRAPILGRVAMNMFVVDVSHIKGVSLEDEVVILGAQGGEEVTAEELAEQSQTINYEVTTRISALLPRVIR